MYTIGQVSELFQLPVSTLRYYDKEGLFPEIKRNGGIRHFDTTELEALRLVECLKNRHGNQKHQAVYAMVYRGQ